MSYWSIFQYVIESSLMGSAMVLLIFLVKIFAGKKINPKVLYCIWMLLLIKLIFPFGPQSKVSIYNAFNPSYESIISSIGNNASINPVTENPASNEALTKDLKTNTEINPAPNVTKEKETILQHLWNYKQIFILLWTMGMLMMASYILLGIYRIRHLCKISRKSYDSILYQLLKSCSVLLKVKAPGIIVTDKVQSPLIYGIFNPTIILPGKIVKELKEEEIRYILLHELCHVKRKDLIIIWITSLLKIVYWFNPVILIGLHFMSADCEIACDTTVLSHLNTDESLNYGNTIINVTKLINNSNGIPCTASIIEKKSQLKRRIIMISKYGKITKRNLIIGVLIIVILGLIGLTGRVIKNSKASSSQEEFLKYYNLKVKETPEKFNITVPKTWDVMAGDYPVGLYWELANEFSKDAGLDLTKLKGDTVQVWRYSLADGLPGQGEQSIYNYPSNAVLLVSSNKVVGAWLCFNVAGIGPSVKKHYLTDITGLTFENWIERKGLFSNLGDNSDLAALSPTDLIKEHFKAINNGNKTRAYACLDPDAMRDSLTMNLNGNTLYNPKFSTDNSQVENIISAKPIALKYLDPKEPGIEIKEIKNETIIEAAITLDIKWRDNFINSNGRQVRFCFLKKHSNEWKLNGLGTGP
ncbi:MAG: M56 family metallopeptidase [Clostridiaceae bacterium]